MRIANVGEKKQMLSTMPTDLLRLILAACAATDLPSLAATSTLLENTTSRRRSIIRMLIADPFNVDDIHCTTFLSLVSKNLNVTHITTFATACVSGALAQLKELRLGFNSIGDVGMAAFADAVWSGAFPALKELWLMSNSIGDAGISTLADSVSRGALAQLEALNLYNNSIGDVGISALADSVSKGALPALQQLSLYKNQIGDAGISALADSMSKGALGKLENLYLSENKIGNAGITALLVGALTSRRTLIVV